MAECDICRTFNWKHWRDFLCKFRLFFCLEYDETSWNRSFNFHFAHEHFAACSDFDFDF